MGSGLTEEKGDLADYPVVPLVDADTPNDEADWRAVLERQSTILGRGKRTYLS